MQPAGDRRAVVRTLLDDGRYRAAAAAFAQQRGGQTVQRAQATADAFERELAH